MKLSNFIRRIDIGANEKCDSTPKPPQRNKAIATSENIETMSLELRVLTPLMFWDMHANDTNEQAIRKSTGNCNYSTIPHNSGNLAFATDQHGATQSTDFRLALPKARGYKNYVWMQCNSPTRKGPWSAPALANQQWRLSRSFGYPEPWETCKATLAEPRGTLDVLQATKGEFSIDGNASGMWGKLRNRENGTNLRLAWNPKHFWETSVEAETS